MLSSNAENLLRQRYYLPGETFEQLCNRIVSAYTKGEDSQYQDYVFHAISNLEFLPNSPAIVNAGKNRGFFACFCVGPTEDNLENHFDTLKDIAQVAKQGGGCFHYNTMVYTSKGIKKIGDIVEEKDNTLKVLSYNSETGKMSMEKVINWHIITTKIKDVVNVSYGKKGDNNLITSNYHPFFVWNGNEILEKRADSIESDDLLIGSSDIPEANSIADEYFWLLGYVTGDGAIGKQTSGGYRVRITDAYLSNLQRVEKITNGKIKKCNDKNAYDIAFYGDLAEKIYKEYDCEPRTHNKHIPLSVVNSSAVQKLSFIVGLLDSDGYFDKSKKVFMYYTISERLAKDFIALCSSIGIKTKFRLKVSKRINEQSIYEIRIKSTLYFNKLIEDYSSKYNDLIFTYNTGLVKLDEKYLKNLNNFSSSFSLKNVKVYGYAVANLAKEILDFNEQNKISNQVFSGFNVNNVESLDNIEDEILLYDITVENNHTYCVADSNTLQFVVVHNCGFTGTFIRPKNSPVNGSTHGYSYGPNNWAKNVSSLMDMMTQSGFRKMALMYTLSSDHADLEEFIDLKQTTDEKALYNFNQSVFATDKFMETATTKIFSNEARMFHKLIENAWNNGEPGLLFDDTINSPELPYMLSGQRIFVVNPCAEEPLPFYGSCNLGSINLGKLVTNGQFNFNKLYALSRIFTKFLDNVGTFNKFPNEKFTAWYKDNRPVGLGIMGFADALLYLGIRYGSVESLNLLEKILETMKEASYEESKLLGKERGIPKSCEPVGRRNITTLTIAPTGSISFIADCMGSGVEPVFSPTYTRIDERGVKYEVENEFFHEPYFVSVVGSQNSLTWKDHLNIQIVAQRYIDSAISKTINFPNIATKDEVRDAFIYAWQNKCKGITVYRDNSRQIQVLNHNEQKPIELKIENPFGCTENSCKIEHKEGCATCSTCGSSACSV